VFSPWITGKKLYEEQNGFRHKQWRVLGSKTTILSLEYGDV